MYATQSAYGAHLVPRADHVANAPGEAVLLAPRHAGRFDDDVFASRASFGWHVATVVLARRGGEGLRYRSQRPTATFAASGLPRIPQPGDRVTRSWDGAVFEIVDVCRDGAQIRCDLVELESRVH